MMWTCLEFVEVHGFEYAGLGSDVQAHLCTVCMVGGCPTPSSYSIFKSQQCR